MLIVWRHPAVPDLVWLTLGALLGAVLFGRVQSAVRVRRR